MNVDLSRIEEDMLVVFDVRSNLVGSGKRCCRARDGDGCVDFEGAVRKNQSVRMTRISFCLGL